MKNGYKSHKWNIFDICEHCGISRTKRSELNPVSGLSLHTYYYFVDNAWTKERPHCKSK